MIGALRALATIALLGACAHAQGYGKFAAGICRVADLDGDGISELAVSDEERRAVWILAPATGEVVRKVEGSGTGGLALPEPDDLFGWQVESLSSSSGDFLSIWGGYLAPGRVPEQKLVNLATGQVVGSFHEGLLCVPLLALLAKKAGDVKAARSELERLDLEFGWMASARERAEKERRAL